MLRKLSSALSSKRLRAFVKKANIIQNMNVHNPNSMAHAIYSQQAARPTNNRVQVSFPLQSRQLPPPPAPTTLTSLQKAIDY